MQKGGTCGALPAGATGPRKDCGHGVSCSVGSAQSGLPGGTPGLAVGFRWAGWLATVAAAPRTHTPCLHCTPYTGIAARPLCTMPLTLCLRHWSLLEHMKTKGNRSHEKAAISERASSSHLTPSTPSFLSSRGVTVTAEGWQHQAGDREPSSSAGVSQGPESISGKWHSG